MLIASLSVSCVQPLNMQIYTRKLSNLLYAEEIQMKEDMKEFDLELVSPIDLFEIVCKAVTTEYLNYLCIHLISLSSRICNGTRKKAFTVPEFFQSGIS